MKRKGSLLLTGIIVLSLTSIYLLDMAEEPARSLSSDSAPANYESLTACEKRDILWEKIESSTHATLPELSALGIPQFIKMTMQKIANKKTHLSDFAPNGWTKYLHKRGAVAKVSIMPVEGQRFTGAFAGSECALLRLSLTYKPTKKKAVAPGLALKVLRDGHVSGNVSALYSIDGQGPDHNIMAKTLSNIVPQTKEFSPKLMHRLFKKVTNYPEELLVTDLASIDSNGEKIASAKAPRQIFFVPNPGLKFKSDPHDFREDLMSIEPGTLIYSVYAASESRKDFDYLNKYTESDIEKFVKESEHIADIVSSSPFVASSFGDEGIFFSHETRP